MFQILHIDVLYQNVKKMVTNRYWFIFTVSIFIALFYIICYTFRKGLEVIRQLKIIN